MSKITKGLFGGGKDKRTQQKIGQNFVNAKEDVLKLVPSAEKNRNTGFQQILDLQSQAIPEQISTFQQGNRGAQNQLIQGLQGVKNTLLGNGTFDPSGLRPSVIRSDTSFADQDVPNFETTGEALINRDAGSAALLENIKNDADLFSAVSRGKFGNFGKGDKDFFRDFLSRNLSELSGSRRLTDNIFGASDELGDILNRRPVDGETGVDFGKSLNPKNLERMRRLLAQFEEL